MKRYILSIVCASVLTACSTWQKTAVDRDVPAMPENYSAATGRSAAPNAWWTIFDSPELNDLQERAFKENLTVVQAMARLRQADAAVISTASQKGVKLDGTATVNEGYEKIRSPSGGFNEGHTESFSIGLAASYEIDFWGRLKAEEQADLLSRDAAAADIDAAIMSVSAEICSRWLAIRYQKGQMELLKRQLKISEDRLGLLEYRFKLGKATALDILQQRQVVAKARAQLPPVTAELEQLTRELNVLLDQMPGNPVNIGDGGLPEVPALPNAGIPAMLLEQRPDIRAAWLRLRGADWDVAAAEADKLPALRLTGSAGSSANELDLLFRNWIANLAASLTVPLLDAGRREATLKRQQAIADERLASYRLTVLTAVKEVDVALAQEQALQDAVTLTGNELEAARFSKQETESRYLNGTQPFLNVLLTTGSLHALERNFLQAKYQLLSGRIQLCRALGGRFNKELTDSSGDTDNGKE